MPERPDRITILDEIGRTVALDEGPSSFMQLSKGKNIVFLGLGPRPGEFPGKIRRGKPTFWMEAPEFMERMDESWLPSLPATFKQIFPEDLTSDFIRTSTLFFYRRNMHLFPQFWGPVMARCKSAAGGGSRGERYNEIRLPGSERDLLMRELESAFGGEGFEVRRIPGDTGPAKILEMLRKRRPKLYFSVNFRGLDPLGENFHLLREEGVEVAVWCVDNPFHLLSRIKGRWWTELKLFVTDNWFIPELEALGAKCVVHLPLAASPRSAEQASAGAGGAFAPAAGLSRRLVFVGRSSFPAKSRFFAGQSADPELMEAARMLLQRGKRPDFGWWLEETGFRPPWPGNQVRGAGFAAEETSRSWRALCLETASRAGSVGGPDGTTVFGDPAWKESAPSLFDIRAEVDYYGPLFRIYAHSGVNLNLTSLLLPHGLTQRHFDVWAAGGFLITDATPGMVLFPPELAEPVTFRKPEDIMDLAAKWLEKSSIREELRASWQRLILTSHTYPKRVREVLERTVHAGANS